MARAAVESMASEEAAPAAAEAAEAAPTIDIVDSGIETSSTEVAAPTTEMAAPSLDTSPLSIDSAPAMRGAAGDAVGMLPEEIRMTLAGMGIEVPVPEGSEVEKTICLNINNVCYITGP